MSTAKLTGVGRAGRESPAVPSRSSTLTSLGAVPGRTPVAVEHQAMRAYAGTAGSLTPEGVLALQRMVGNAAVSRLLQRSAPPRMRTPLQRSVHFDQMTGETSIPTVEQIVTWLDRGGYPIAKGSIEEDTIKFMRENDEPLTFKWAYGQPQFMAALKDRKETARDTKHRTWLIEERKRLMETNEQLLEYLPLLFHEEALGQKTFEHFKNFDSTMLWRFTSLPSQESIVIGPGTTYEEILRVTASHSGGNDKSNEKVKTLSFGRNIGALMGTAASKGGDKKVLYIIDKAEYLYGVDMNSLKGKGITAHPAMARSISLFESEYILVSTPGDPPQSLESLATVKFKNPFQGTAADSVLEKDPSAKSGLEDAERVLKTITPEYKSSVDSMDEKMVKDILLYAEAVRKAANEFTPIVQDKENIQVSTVGSLQKIMLQYIESIKRNLKDNKK